MADEMASFRAWLDQRRRIPLCAIWSATPGAWVTPDELHVELHRNEVDPEECIRLASAKLKWLASIDQWAHVCSGCGADAVDEWYMVRDSVWTAAGMCGFGYLCIGCLERRLGRRLSAADFADLPVNSSATYKRSSRLASRLATT